MDAQHTTREGHGSSSRIYAARALHLSPTRTAALLVVAVVVEHADPRQHDRAAIKRALAATARRAS